jgi:arylsulfatase A-like enzyme
MLRVQKSERSTAMKSQHSVPGVGGISLPLVFLAALGASVLSGTLRAADSQAAQKPNLVFILADDLGWTDLGCYGSRYYETPNIDRLATQGMRFTSGYTCGPNCAPTRAALMSGQYGPRTGIYTVGSIARFNWRSRPLRPVDNIEVLSLQKVTLAEALKAAGYATGHFGKWHLGAGAQGPQGQGFDVNVGGNLAGNPSSYFSPYHNKDLADGPPGEYLTDRLTEEAVRFIRANRDRPFFLYLPHYAVHTPLQARQDLLGHFQAKPPVDGHRNPTYAAMIASVDESVGRVLAALDELKLADHTLVIFASDNGGVGGYAREGIQAGDITDNIPLRGGKGMLYEGGIRVPFIFRWPGHIAPGAVCDEPINSVDLYPTLLELARAPRPQNHVLDGTSYLGLLTGGVPGERPPLFWHFPGYLGAGGGTWRTTPAGAIRDGDWKLLEFFEDGRLELYNLKDDPGERTNLAAARPDQVGRLYARLVAWRQEANAPMPTRNTDIVASGKKSPGKKASEKKR